MNIGTKNHNILNSSKAHQGPKRRFSRQSAAVFTPIDFDYRGNTNSVHHLIKKAGREAKAPSVLNHELNLRNYESTTKYKAEEPWAYPRSKIYDPVALDKPSFGHSHELGTSPGKKPLETYNKRTKTPSLIPYLTADEGTKFNTKYRIKNHNELNHIRQLNTNIPTLAFMASMRISTSDNKPQMYTGIKRKNHDIASKIETKRASKGKS